MNLKKTLTTETIIPQLTPGSKEEVITQMIDGLFQPGKVKDREKALQAVLDREAKMSTGMQNGIAIPHGKTDSVDQLIVGVGICREGVDFAAIDGQPCHIFIMTLSPENRTGPHIQFLAEISKVLGNEQLRNDLKTATSASDILAMLTT
jgi:PTS system nitrogen regulatory IIA component